MKKIRNESKEQNRKNKERVAQNNEYAKINNKKNFIRKNTDTKK